MVGCQAQVREDLQALLRVPEASGQLLVDRLRQLRRELVLGRRAHQVHLRDEHAVLDELLGHPPHQRGLAVPARREDHHVLAVAGVGYEAVDLVLAIREGLVEGERAELEGVGGELRCHQRIMLSTIMYLNIMSADIMLAQPSRRAISPPVTPRYAVPVGPSASPA